jgi:hypothetical protein
MRNHAFVFSALFFTGALFPLPEFLSEGTLDSTPNPRHLEEIAYNDDNDALFLFGGAELRGSTWTEPDDFFEYKRVWTKQNSKGPIGRRGHAMVYDESSRAIVIIAGVAQTAPVKDSVLFDTWNWLNGKWSMTDTKCPVKEPSAVYDVSNKSILVYGDVMNLSKPWDGGDQRKFELWELKSNKWKKLSDTGPSNGPLPLAYNKKNKSLSMLEWTSSDQLILWEWRNNQWTKTTSSSDFPEMRGKYSFTYSKSENALFLFGGVDSNRDLLGDFWKYDGARWKKIESANAPTARASLRLVDGGGRLLLFGGLKKEGLTNELWEFKNDEWKKL